MSVENRKHGLPRIKLLRESGAAVKFLSIEPLLEDLGPFNLKRLDWVIVGGESGPRARPMESAWVEKIQAQCKCAGIPFFFKQWGGVQKSRTGRTLHGRTYNEVPVFTERRVPTMRERGARMRLTMDLIAA